MLKLEAQVPAPITPHTTDAELASRAARGDAVAFEAIMRRHNRLLFRTARSILKRDAEAEDALQEAYLRAWRGLQAFRSDAGLSTWLVRIVANEALERRRRKTAQIIPLDAAMNSTEPEIQDSLSDDPDHRPEELAMRGQLRKLLEARIDLLPEAFRIVFMLRVVEEMSVEEVSQALGIAEATVRTRLFRARSLLREGLASQVDVALNDTFAFDGARCDRIVAGVLARAAAAGLSG
jgi:RNA polymerase sigma-70 factor (ECF subfamily)